MRPYSEWIALTPWTSLMGAVMLFAWDGVLWGMYLFSMLICPVWFLLTVLTLALERPGWRSAGWRLLIPPLTLAIVLSNYVIQREIADFRGKRIIQACEDFFVTHGRYPDELEKLVPRYLRSVPRARYCVFAGHFIYRTRNAGNGYLLLWGAPFNTRTYGPFDRRPNDTGTSKGVGTSKRYHERAGVSKKSTLGS